MFGRSEQPTTLSEIPMAARLGCECAAGWRGDPIAACPASAAEGRLVKRRIWLTCEPFGRRAPMDMLSAENR